MGDKGDLGIGEHNPKGRAPPECGILIARRKISCYTPLIRGFV
jgi:hypothetical protein